MFLDAPQLFVSDGVHADLVRPGEPRLWSRSSRRRSQVAARPVAAEPRRSPLLSALRPSAA